MNKSDPQPLQLNQAALQDFLDCPRRFELRYLHDTVWPAASGSPLSKFEHLTELGNQFHHLCLQFFTGINEELLTASISDSRLIELWESFLPYGRTLLNLTLLPEQILRVPFDGHFLVAKYDLIVQLPDQSLTIIDWKTAAKKPPRTQLANRVQSYLYPFILQLAGGPLFARSGIEPSSITMKYFYPLASQPEEVFPFSEEQQLQSQSRISALLEQIQALTAAAQHFPLTEDLSTCQYCRYRSFCERDYQTSPLPLGLDLENEDLSSAHFDLDLIIEIDF